MKILLDTNMLLDCTKYRVDFSAQLHGHELITLSSCFNELEKLGKKRGKAGEAARIALIMARAKGVIIVRSAEKNADAAILRHALREKQSDFAVATNDRALIKSLKKNGIRIIRLREKKKLTEA
ncbi:MAG: hypothetical protein HYW26_03745 [Candidatus Aenigmarchaeota archaeon]|nr:hypothetical protein [Candidatus Aenigmarchaeota archaeon]